MKASTLRRSLSGSAVISAFVVVLFTAWLSAPAARAVPSFTRQTGFPCSSCHTTPPELTPLGRQFKLNGYTMTGMPTTTVPGKGKESGLNLLQTLPLSVFFDAAYTSTNTKQTGTQNGSFEFPEDVSLFLAGQWAKHVGSFVQLTYDTQNDHFSWDNTDIRYANTTKLGGKDMAWGISMNNSPTVEDLWNSTPAWGYPFINNDFAPTPVASAIVNLSLAQDVAGVGAYTMLNNHFYIASTMYRTNHVGTPQPFNGMGSVVNINNLAPYWRGAYQTTKGNNYVMVGTYGMWVKSSPNCFSNGCSTTFKDHYTDYAFDFQYDRTIPRFHNDILSIRGTYIRENSSLNAAADAGATVDGLVPHHLNSLQANMEYHFGNKYSAAFGWFQTTGTRDITFYNSSLGADGTLTIGCGDTPCAISGSADGSPRSNGYIVNLSWWPVQNIQLAGQYTAYFNFNGRSINYDGNGRNASDNNTMYILARFVF
jgi:hypothetical protein